LKRLSVGECDIVVAVAGNPNVGKSTLFNRLTGELVHVANWPGVTVARSEGRVIFDGRRICFVDLPGTYGLSSTSPEERVARDYIVSGEPDVILVLADALAPERTLYLPVQVLELTSRVIVAFNKIDAAHAAGIHIHVDGFSRELRTPVIAISASTGQGLDELLRIIVEEASQPPRREPLTINYGTLEPYIDRLVEMIKPRLRSDEPYPARWIAVKLLEGDEDVEKYVEQHYGQDPVEEALRMAGEYAETYGRPPSETAISSRYSFVDSLVRRHVVRKRVEYKPSRMDEMFLKPVLGPLLSTLILFLILFIAFTVNTGFPLNLVFSYMGYEGIAEALEKYSLSGLLGMLFNMAGNATSSGLSGIAPDWLTSLIANGIIGGVGAVLSFLPLIMIVYALLGALEDSGLAARIAMSFDSTFRRFGASGKAVFPYILSLGCNVPGVLSTRALEEREERIAVALSVPLVPCQARLVVIMAFASVLFKGGLTQALVVLSIYLLAITLALIVGKAIRALLLGKKEPPELLLEIPPIHNPSWRVVWWHTWDNSKHFLKKAGTVILVLSMVSWFLLSYGPGGAVNNPANSYAAMLGRLISPLASMYGVHGDTAWKLAYAFENGFIAKEGVLDAVMLLYPQAKSVSDAVRALGINAVQAYSFLVAMTLYVPCVATIAVIYSETRRASYAALTIAYMIVLAIIVSAGIYWVLEALL